MNDVQMMTWRWDMIDRYGGLLSVFLHSPDKDHAYPANMRHRPNVKLMLGQRRRRWTNIGSTLGRCLVLAGYRQRITSRHAHETNNAKYQQKMHIYIGYILRLHSSWLS